MRHGMLLYVLMALLLVGCGDTEPTIITGEAMGSRYHIKLAGDHPPAEELSRDIAALMDEIEDQASQWREGSWVSRFNRSDSLEPVAVPGHVWAMLLVAERVHRESGGLLDVTIGPVVELWGFGHDPEATPPSDERLAEVMAGCGFDKLVLNHASQTVTRTVAGVQIDLSALAKGYAVDRVDALLRERGLSDYLIDFGGEVLARGGRLGPDRRSEGWVIAVPVRDGGARHVQASEHAYASSGGAERHREIAGQTVTHLIDPRTGRPTSDAAGTVTVVMQRCVVADAWATALAVASRDEAEQLARASGVGLLGDTR